MIGSTLSNYVKRLILTSLLLMICPTLTSPLLAQESVPKNGSQSVSPTGAAATVSEVEAALDAIEKDANLEESIKAPLRSKYREAIDALKAAAEYSAKATELQDLVTTGSDKAAELRKQLGELPSVQQAAQVSSAGDLSDLQKSVDSQRAAAKRLSDELAKLKIELTRVKGRPSEISSQLPDVQRRANEVQEQLKSPSFAEDASSTTRTADRILLRSREVSLLAELEMLKQEQASQAIREDWLQAQEGLLVRQAENALATSNALDEVLQKRLASEAQLVRSKAASLPLEKFKGDETLQTIVVEVQELAKRFDRVVQDRERVSTALDNLDVRLAGLAAQYTSIRDQLELGGGGGTMVQTLFNLQRQVLNAEMIVPHDQIPTLSETRLASILIDEKLRGQTEIEQKYSDSSSEAVDELITMRRELLEKLTERYNSLTRSLAQVETDRRTLLNTGQEIRNYIVEQLFWLRSSPAIGLNAILDIPASFKWYFHPKHREEFRAAARWAAGQAPIRGIFVFAVVVLLLVFRPRIGAALEQTGTLVHRISTDRYAHTGKALVWTLLLALPLPLSFAFAGWAIKLYPSPSGWLQDAAMSMEIDAWICLVAAFAASVCRPGGLATAHFGWRVELVAQYHRSVIQVMFVYILSVLFTFSYHLYGEACSYLESVGRIVFMMTHIWTAMILLRLFRSPHGVVTNLTDHHPDWLMTRSRVLWCSAVVAAPLVLVFLAGIGYLVTAMELSLGLFFTAALIALGVVLYSLVLRWFKIKRRRLALAEAIDRRRAMQEAAAELEQQETPGEVFAVDSEDELQLDLDSISEQTHTMLRLLFTLGTATLVLVYWSNKFPLISVLESWRIPLSGGRSMRELMAAVLIGVVTYHAVHNLPGLLELAVLRARSLETGTRYAITTLSKYLLTAVGLALMCGVLRVDWAKFGWIAAALSVGLGFGLQEVVANFVCGIILLFEQPIRVGDIVTIEGTTGTVTRIRMRATTITNWDRHELVVPNKTLITNTLLNWTLSATVNRVNISVGVAYGSDTEQARQVLLDVAADHPLILDDPPPMATFEQFADSSLLLTLRAFLPDLDNRLGTITDLHTEIDRRFAKAGIEISFPQRDLHLRSGWDTAFPSGATSEKANGNDDEEDLTRTAQPSSSEARRAN